MSDTEYPNRDGNKYGPEFKGLAIETFLGPSILPEIVRKWVVVADVAFLNLIRILGKFEVGKTERYVTQRITDTNRPETHHKPPRSSQVLDQWDWRIKKVV